MRTSTSQRTARGSVTGTDVLPDDAEVAISAVTVSELLVGVELADDRHRKRRAEVVAGVIARVEVIACRVLITTDAPAFADLPDVTFRLLT
jgi:predicted nucleic acid-binding protein